MNHENLSRRDLHVSFGDYYAQLRVLARSRLAREQSPISTGTLAHEVYLSLQGREDLRFSSMQEFLGYAGRTMRSLLVDMARERGAQKREAEMLSLTEGHEVADRASTPEQMLALNQVLERLGRADPRLLQVAEMRALAGLEIGEIAAALGLSEPTVKRDWQRAKAFLHEALGAPS